MICYLLQADDHDVDRRDHVEHITHAVVIRSHGSIKPCATYLIHIALTAAKTTLLLAFSTLHLKETWGEVLFGAENGFADLSICRL